MSNQELIQAISTNDLDQVKTLISQGVDINSQDSEALCLACEYGHFNIVKYLIQQGADIHGKGKNIFSHKDNALFLAFNKGHLDIIKYLIESNNYDDYEKAFSLACGYGHLEIVKYLNEEVGAYFPETECHGLHCNSVFESVCGQGHLDIVRYLVEEHIIDPTEHRCGVISASNSGHLNILEYLAEYGADIHLADEFCLRWACSRDNLDIVKFFIERGADAHAYYERSEGNAFEFAAENGQLDIIKYLFENCEHNIDDIYDAIFKAKDNNYPEVVKYLEDLIDYSDDEDEDENVDSN